MIIDAIIINENDELYDLQQKYDVKISRSQSSQAVYIYRQQSYKVRVGHPISKNQHHLRNFAVNVNTNKVSRDIVEKTIQRFFK